MTMQDLDQYAAMKAECADLRERIRRLEAGAVQDRVQGSMDEHPYTLRSFAVEGIPPKRASGIQELRILLADKERALVADLVRIEKWMKGIPDAQVRRAIRMRYVDGMTWRRVSRLVFGSMNASTAYMAVERSIKNKVVKNVKE